MTVDDKLKSAIENIKEPRRDAHSALKMFFNLYLEDMGDKEYEHVKFLKKMKELGYPQNIYLNQ